MEKEQMNIVIVGHVDHGKSTVVGRLMSDTGSLPQGKLDQVKERCRKESRVFEYAFLLDALKDEQSQGITIDSARCFFKSAKRDYIIIDAPGHIEFLKNMVSGAARAEAALLVIDAKEGLMENSKRHGYLLSMLGIKQVAVCINKMDLVGYKQEVYEKIKKEYSEFLSKINIKATEFLPISALNGENIVSNKGNLSWFKGRNILQTLDSFEKEKKLTDKPFRMPVQDIYKFTASGDERRIIAGRAESGTLRSGNEVIFLPSHKKTIVSSVESFNEKPSDEFSVGQSKGVTLAEQIYVARGEIMCRSKEQLPYVGTKIKSNIFWMGKQPFVMDKEYKLKIGTAKVNVRLYEITSVLDASNLNSSSKDKIERHEVAEVILECAKPIAFDLNSELQPTGRFVIVDNYDIVGGGIINSYIEDSQSKTREQVFLREQKWDNSLISFNERGSNYGQVPKLILITGPNPVDKKTIAKKLEKILFDQGRKAYFLGIGNLLRGLDSDISKTKREEHIRRLGEVSHILMDAGLLVVATASDLTDEELKMMQTITFRDEMIVISFGDLNKDMIDLNLDEKDPVEHNLSKIMDLLRFKKIIFSF